MFKKEEIFELIKKVPQELKTRMYEKELTAKEIIMHQGIVPDIFAVLLDGMVKVYQNTPKGDVFLYRILTGGEILGELEIITNSPCIANVEAIEQSKILYMDKSVYINWLKTDSEFSLYINKVICQRIIKLAEKTATALCFPLEYSFLKFLDHKFQASDDNEIVISKNLLTESMGTTLRNTNRILKKIIGKNIIDYKKGRIKLLSESKLKAELESYEQ